MDEWISMTASRELRVGQKYRRVGGSSSSSRRILTQCFCKSFKFTPKKFNSRDPFKTVITQSCKTPLM